VTAAARGEPAAAQLLVEAFLPSILGLSRTFQGARQVEHQDLVQEGVAGLLHATRRYDSRRGTPFWAYASFWVRKAMQELVADLTRPVALSDRAVKALAAVRAARSEFLQKHGKEPTTGELERVTGLSRTQLERLQTADRPARSMEEHLGPHGEGAATVGEGLVDPSAEAAYESVLDDIEWRHVRLLADQLAERERAVIRAHYGLGEPAQTLGQIGSALGLTAERARQIEATALTRLRDALVPPARAATANS